MPNTLKEKIRTVPHWPKKGIMFRDITTLLKDSEGFNHMIDLLTERYKDMKIDIVAGIESRGFITGAVLAHKLGVGFVPIRKPGKLPAETESQTYQLEYGLDKIEIHKDAIQPGDQILIHDDLLATGGTAEATCKLVEKLGGEVVQLSFLIELTFLNGREKLRNYNISSLITYDDEN